MEILYYTFFNFIQLVINFSYFLFVDYLIKYIASEKNPKTRWYFIHFIANSIIASNTYENVYYAFIDPKNIMNQPFSTFNINFTMALHIFHIFTSRKELTLTDWIHHMVSCIFVCSIALYLVKNSIIDYLLFFMCGLPGGIDYFLLVLCKYKLISKLTEKSINRWLNLLIRMPFMMLCDWYIILNLYHGNITLRVYIWTIIGCKLMLINSIYYCNKTVGNYHIRFQQHKDKKTIKRSKILKSRSEADICKLKTN